MIYSTKLKSPQEDECGMTASKNNNSKYECGLYIAILMCFFILIEISFFIQCNSMYLGDFTFVSRNLAVPPRILIDIFYFLLVQLLLHSVFGFAIWLVVKDFIKLFNVSSKNSLTIVLIFWLIAVVTLLAANQYFFPNSKFAELSANIFFNDDLLKFAYYILLSSCIAALLLSSIFYAKRLFLKTRIGFGIIISMLIASSVYVLMPVPHEKAIYLDNPNVIIIGIDSLRPDFLGFFGGESRTPFLNTFLSKATVFAEAITPLARTFPSWVSILTGRYPVENGVRFNLASMDKINLADSLAAILQQQGYQTIYGTDETRFSNIDQTFGFDKIISPPIGLADFLIGTFNDFPLSNLIVNTTLGKGLFPYSYSNRAVYHTYNPNTFLNYLQTNIDKINVKQPVFLTVHFCLPHYPYLWSSLSGRKNTPWERYQAAIERTDVEVNTFLQMLNTKNLLQHAMVVLVSDHGEALEFDGDRVTQKENFLSSKHNLTFPIFYPPSLDTESVNQSAGHGTDVLSLPQYHSLLAFRLFDAKLTNKTNVLAGVKSLLDVKPTILNYILPTTFTNYNTSGETLLPFITGEMRLSSAPKHLFLESDYSPAAIRTVYPQTRQVLLEGVALFEINPKTTRLIVKKSMGEMIIKAKQLADIYGKWMLALYPQNQKRYIPVIINLQTGKWTTDLQSAFAQQSPANKMLAALKDFFHLQQDNLN